MPRQLALLMALAVLSPLVAAEGDPEWKSWIDSPEAYFATEQERATWSKLEVETDAHAFIETYFARRGDRFQDELRRRVALADEHLSWKDQPGSSRLQGKLVILLGTPTSIMKRNHSEIGRPHIGIPGTVPSNVSQVSLEHMNPGDDLYTYRFSDDALLDQIDVRGALLVHIAVDTSSGEESIPDRKERERIEEIFEIVAAGSIVDAD